MFRKGFLKDRPQIKSHKYILQQLTKENCVATINLIYQDHSSNGLFLYKCQADEAAKKFLLHLDKDQFPTFYCIKQLYHNHLFHKKSKQKNQYKDYYFRAFLTNKINIKDKNNNAIMFYLEEILEHFEMQLKHFEVIKANAQKRVIDNSSIKELQEWINNATE